MTRSVSIHLNNCLMILICILGTNQIREYRFLKIQYKSTINWWEKVDYLHCSLFFHQKLWYNCVIVDMVRGPIFARLVLTFNYKIEGENYLIVLIHPFNAAISRPHRQKDINFGLFCLCAKPQTSCEFIFVWSIIHGALLVEDFKRKGDLLVVDIVDMNMFIYLQ